MLGHWHQACPVAVHALPRPVLDGVLQMPRRQALHRLEDDDGLRRRTADDRAAFENRPVHRPGGPGSLGHLGPWVFRVVRVVLRNERQRRTHGGGSEKFAAVHRRYCSWSLTMLRRGKRRVIRRLKLSSCSLIGPWVACAPHRIRLTFNHAFFRQINARRSCGESRISLMDSPSQRPTAETCRNVWSARH